LKTDETGAKTSAIAEKIGATGGRMFGTCVRIGATPVMTAVFVTGWRISGTVGRT
jgi:hypothetical protein